MRVTDIIGCVFGALVLMYAAVVVPLFGTLLMFTSPLLFLFYATRLGLKQGIVLACLSIMAVSVVSTLTGHRQTIVFCIEFSVLGIVLSELFRRRFSLGETVTIALGAMSLFGFLILFGLGAARGLSPSEIIVALLREQFEAASILHNEIGSQAEDAQAANQFAEAFVQAVARIYPALMVIGMGLIVILNVMLARPLFERLGLDYPEFEPFERWKAPEKMVWGLIVAGFGSLFASGTPQTAAVNCLLVMVVVYFFQGLSIGIFYLNKYRVPLLLKGILYILVVIQQLLVLMLAVVGLFDQWFDFRRLRNENRPSDFQSE